MRTTLDIGDDVLLAAKERARLEKKTTGEVMTELAREALTRPRAADTDRNDDRVLFGFRPFPKRGAVITSEMINRIRDEEGI